MYHEPFLNQMSATIEKQIVAIEQELCQLRLSVRCEALL